MKFSENWLRTWVNPPVDTATLVEQLTTAGLEVDSVEAVAPPVKGVVVGHVLSVAPHPDADRLRVCTVDVGQGEPLNIVCGAPNVHQGMRAPTALVGTEMPGGMKIKRAKLRGVESFGMLCSDVEIGLAETSDGLMPLPADAPVGQEIMEFLGLNDSSIDVDLTPNRGDCLGIAGIAREVGVINRCPVTVPAMEPVVPAIGDEFPVTVEAPADCPRYVGRVVRNIDPKATTPLWMQERLRRSGLRSIGAIVDITNYVLLELGQPMHAFDLECLEGGIRVRRSAAGETITLLDGSEVSLDPETLVIADEAGPQALAGIMGGEATAVAGDTRHIFLESAYFTPETIAGKARRYGKHSDSSHRFERGVDFELQRRAMERATALVLEVVGGEAGPIIEAVAEAHLPRRDPITLRRERVRRVLGMDVPAPDIADTLQRLGMRVEEVEGGWRVTPPGFRFDMAVETDLIEEIARIVGYDAIPSAAPLAHLEIRHDRENRVGLARMRRLLADRGYQEAITYSFVDPALQQQLNPGVEAIALSNPISSDMSVMRTSLWPGLVAALRHNQNRQQTRVRLFESGLRFERGGEGMVQETMLAGIAAGGAWSEQWGLKGRDLDFYDVKADLEALLDLGGEAEAYRFAPDRHPALHPGQSARIERDGRLAGRMGALHPRLLGELDINGPVYLFELNLAEIENGLLPRFEAPSRFPAIRRDIAVIVDGLVSAQAVRDCIGQAAPDVLKNLQLFDVYLGEHIDSGKKSLALGLTLQAPEKTLTDEEVDSVIGTVLGSLEKQLGAVLRG